MHNLRLQWIYPVAISLFLAALIGSQPAQAHCDTLDGPVIADAREALARRHALGR